MSRFLYSPQAPKSATIVGVICMLLGTAGLILYKKESLNTSSNMTPNQKPAIETAYEKASKPEHVVCRVLTVYDGDTLACDLNKNNQVDKPGEEIRLLGIDTPEMHYSKKNRSHNTKHEQDEPFAKEASALLTKHADKKSLYLTFDEVRYDKYGRTLAYASLTPNDETGLCKLMLTQGVAKTLFIPPNFKHANDFKALEQHARSLKLGIWSE